MAIPATQMRPGMIIKHNDQLHLVFKVEHRTPGNLRAFIQAKLRNLHEVRRRLADVITRARTGRIQHGLTPRVVDGTRAARDFPVQFS